MIKQIIRLLYEKYFFIDEKTDIYKYFCKEAIKLNPEINITVARRLNQLLMLFNDPHLSFQPSYDILSSRQIPMFFHSDKCYCSLDNSIKEVTAIDNMSISDVLNLFPCSNKQQQYSACLTDILLSDKSELMVQFVDSSTKTISLDRKIRHSTNKDVIINKILNANQIIGNTGIIKILSFGYPHQYESFVNTLNQLSHCSNLLVDLRANHGGIINDAIKCVSHLINKEVFLHYLKTKETETPVIIYPNKNKYKFDKIIILQDEFTSSCAETIFIPALINSGENVITVGQTSSGWFSQATKFSFKDHSNLTITSGIYLDKNKNVIPNIGIKPNKLLNLSPSSNLDYSKILELSAD